MESTTNSSRERSRIRNKFSRSTQRSLCANAFEHHAKHSTTTPINYRSASTLRRSILHTRKKRIYHPNNARLQRNTRNSQPTITPRDKTTTSKNTLRRNNRNTQRRTNIYANDRKNRNDAGCYRVNNTLLRPILCSNNKLLKKEQKETRQKGGYYGIKNWTYLCRCIISAKKNPHSVHALKRIFKQDLPKTSRSTSPRQREYGNCNRTQNGNRDST